MQRSEAAKVPWPLPEGWDEEGVEKALFGESRPSGQFPERVRPDFPTLHTQLQQHPHLTLQLAWEEYRQVHPEGYGYSRFCELYGRWRKKQDVVLRQEHQPGEKGFVDWAGATIPVHDPVSGEIRQAPLFVMVLGASSYTYAEATRDQQLTAWLSAHMHSFEYFGGVPRLLVPDNPRTGVSRACRYDPDLNPTYQEFAMHYGVGVVPARPYRPRDKAKVEQCGTESCLSIDGTGRHDPSGQGCRCNSQRRAVCRLDGGRRYSARRNRSRSGHRTGQRNRSGESALRREGQHARISEADAPKRCVGAPFAQPDLARVLTRSLANQIGNFSERCTDGPHCL
jgi:transposase